MHYKLENTEQHQEASNPQIKPTWAASDRTKMQWLNWQGVAGAQEGQGAVGVEQVENIPSTSNYGVLGHIVSSPSRVSGRARQKMN